MAAAWHWFVVIGTLGSLAAMVWLLLANRKVTPNDDTGHEWDGIQELDNPLPMWWVYMFVISIVFALGYLVFFPGLGNYEGQLEWSSAGKHDVEADEFHAQFQPLYEQLAARSDSELVADPLSRQIGRRLFLNHCSTCHGINAEGSAGFPNLQDSEWLYGDDLATITQTVLNGRQAAMPGWQAALQDDGVLAVSHYVRSLSSAEHDAGLAAAGEGHFKTFCVACHQADGTGNPALGAPDLTNSIWLYGGSLAAIQETVANGRSGKMPAHGDLLGAERARILAAYVVGLDAGD
ncbi:MAG: cytochrome-c oxidase, cbb3-type subunit III [Pseudomonadota bacterium]